MTESLFIGKAAESYVWTRLLEHSYVPYVPLLDVKGVDLVVETPEGGFCKLQVKSRGFPLPEKGSYGEEIKDLWWTEGEVAFDCLVIVLPKNDSQGHEAWVVPALEVKEHLSSKGGDLTLSRRLLLQEWKQFHENWRLTTEA
ncbi:MAG: hypothetical protein IH955_10435 [Chloroflexi bacterium]|nr:hypothetical protein [Chloroflexota bacterium]